jgi:hypothetical protein
MYLKSKNAMLVVDCLRDYLTFPFVDVYGGVEWLETICPLLSLRQGTRAPEILSTTKEWTRTLVLLLISLQELCLR